jgi:hypothetical protein
VFPGVELFRVGLVFPGVELFQAYLAPDGIELFQAYLVPEGVELFQAYLVPEGNELFPAYLAPDGVELFPRLELLFSDGPTLLGPKLFDGVRRFDGVPRFADALTFIEILIGSKKCFVFKNEIIFVLISFLVADSSVNPNFFEIFRSCSRVEARPNRAS